jgi:DNA-binding NarL/FixJ family response regulator
MLHFVRVSEMGVLTLARGGCSLKSDDPSLQVRVLVVDDHEPFRCCVSSILGKQPNLQIIGEAQDGIDAIQRAEALQPDLILLDIGLPGLNGIEVARRIGQTSPASRIIFLTQESSADMVREAFNSGAWGYVIKTQAGRELLIAVETVLQGKQFVSSGLNEHGVPKTP